MVALTWGIVIIAALADSINPCVFGVLIFMLAFMAKAFNSMNRMLIGGLIYTAAVYVTYLLLGIGIFTLAYTAGFAIPFYWFAAIVSILAGILEIKDFFWYGRGLSLQIFPSGAARIKRYVNRFKRLERHHPICGYIAALGLGILVPFVELPCTGAPYLAILGLLSAGEYMKAIPLLLVYNLIFILPLFVIIGLMYFGATSKKMEAWRKEHRGLMRLGIGLFLLALGAYMLWSVV